MIELKTNMGDEELKNGKVELEVTESQLWYMMLALHNVGHKFKAGSFLLSDELHKIGVDKFKWAK